MGSMSNLRIRNLCRFHFCRFGCVFPSIVLLGGHRLCRFGPRYETRLPTRITVSEVAYTLTFLTFSNSSNLALSSIKTSEEALGFG
jgi:hypothetical protein